MGKSNINIGIFETAGDQPAADVTATRMNVHRQHVWLRCSLQEN
jgi:hypothetical protein